MILGSCRVTLNKHNIFNALTGVHVVRYYTHPSRCPPLSKYRKTIGSSLAGPPQSSGRSETLNVAVESQITTVRNIIQVTVEVVDRTPEDFTGFNQPSEETTAVGARIAALRQSASTSHTQSPLGYAQSLVSCRISLFEGKTGSLEDISLIKHEDWVTGVPVYTGPPRERKGSDGCPNTLPKEELNVDATPLQPLKVQTTFKKT